MCISTTPTMKAALRALAVLFGTSQIIVSALPQFPPLPMTSASTTISTASYGNGTYYSSSSSALGSNSWNAFDQSFTTAWTSQVVYSQTTGLYTGSAFTIVNFVAVYGEWVQIQLPYPISIFQYQLWTVAMYPVEGPSSFILAGSSDGSTWAPVDTRTNVTNWPGIGFLFTLPQKPTAYTYYRLIGLANNIGVYPQDAIAIEEWYLYQDTSTTSVSPTISVSPSWTASISFTSTATPSTSVTASASPTISLSASVTPTATGSLTTTPTTTVRISPSVSPSPTPLPSPTPFAHVWGQYGRDAGHTGQSSQPGFVGALAAPRWTFLTGNAIGTTAAIAADGSVYFGSTDAYVYALNSDGSMRWSFKTGAPVVACPALAASGTVFVGSKDKAMYALNPSTGSIVWTVIWANVFVAPPAVGSDGTVYAPNDDKNLLAFHGSTGTLAWNYTMTAKAVVAPAVTANGATVLVTTLNGYVSALSSSNGGVSWSFVSSVSPGSAFSSPSTDSVRVYLGGADNYVYALALTSGAVVWAFPTQDAILAAPCLTGDGNTDYTVIIASTDGTVYGLNASSGGLLWSYTGATGVSFSLPPALGSASAMFLIGSDNVVRAVSTNGSAALLWSYPFGSVSVGGPPVITNTLSILVPAGNSMYCLASPSPSASVSVSSTLSPSTTTTSTVSISTSASSTASSSASPSASWTAGPSASVTPSVTTSLTLSSTLSLTGTASMTSTVTRTESGSDTGSVTYTVPTTASVTFSCSVTLTSSTLPSATTTVSPTATNTPFLPKNCIVASNWSPWSSCVPLSLCDSTGYESRSLSIEQYPLYGGSSCPAQSSLRQLAHCSTVPPLSCSSACSDGVKDDGESGIDCGGTSGCAPCSLGQSCTNDADCSSNSKCSAHGVCTSNLVIATSFYVNGSLTILGLSQSELLSVSVLSLISQTVSSFFSAAVGVTITSWSFGILSVANATGACAVMEVPSGSAPLSVGVTVDYFVALDLNGLAPDRAPTLGALNVALINSAVNAESLLFFSLSTIVPSVCSISFVSADGHGGQLCSYSTQSLLQSSGGGGGGGGSVGGTTGSLVVIIGGVCGALIVLSAAAFGSFCYLHRKHRSLVRKFSARPARLEEEEGKQSSSARGHMSLTLSPLQAARLQDRIDYDDESGLPFPQASRAGMQTGSRDRISMQPLRTSRQPMQTDSQSVVNPLAKLVGFQKAGQKGRSVVGTANVRRREDVDSVDL